MTPFNVEALVLDFLEKTGPCGLDDLVTYLPQLSWGQVFATVDNMSRSGRVLIHQVGYSTYQIVLASPFIQP